MECNERRRLRGEHRASRAGLGFALRKERDSRFMDAPPTIATQYQPQRKRRKRRRRRLRRILPRLAVLFGLIALWRGLHRPAPAVKPASIDNRKSPIETVSLPDPPGIVLHASDSPAKSGGQPFNAARLEEIHAHDHPGWATLWEGKTYHIGYHFVVLPNGTVETGRPIYCPGCHTVHHNDWIGICVVGAFSTISNPRWWPSRPTTKQMASVTALCEKLMSEYHIPPEKVKRHRDLRSTWCPGSRFPYFPLVRTLQTYAAAHPETHAPTHLIAKLPPPSPRTEHGRED